MSGLPAPGEGAPNFELPAADGSIVSLEGLAGRPLLLFFFPRASTPG